MKIGEIDTNLPIPPSTREGKYISVINQARKLEIGHSFPIRPEPPEELKGQRIRQSLQRHPTLQGKKWVVKHISPDLVRVWRKK